MLCQHCGKRPATMRLLVWNGKEKTEQYLCEECAAAEGHFNFAPEMAMSNLLPNFFSDFFSTVPALFQDINESKVCPTCGLSYSTLLRDGRPGCPDCYEFFADALDSLLMRIHGAIDHEGKILYGLETVQDEQVKKDKELSFRDKIRKAKAAKSAKEHENEQKAEFDTPLAKLNKEIIEAIKEERFEDAAKLRDQIHALEQEQKNDISSNGINNADEKDK